MNAEDVWRSDAVAARLMRALLAPAERAMAGGVAVRNALYDRGALRSRATPIPAVSIGNLTVGGTGKTPVAAWLAQRLAAGGASPAIVLRGYGGDEPLVHAVLNPSVTVIVAADRARGVADAAGRGASVAVLDDAFQHRRVARDADIVLVAADGWSVNRRLLPSGPWREPLEALGRADLAVITSKAASETEVIAARLAITHAAPDTPIAFVALGLGDLFRLGDPGARLPLGGIAGASVLAIAAVGNPDAFFAQLRQAGAIVNGQSFPDHHRFTHDEIGRLAARAPAAGMAVCTLKDAVKIAPLWPADAPALWYVSQPVRVESGAEHFERLLDALQARRDAL
ncbi:MAG TPA: tetraacyldisaccharide 4'-kinase [Gemmatimonadaceae bacterium]|nr:tetraacyldisaccharide 4'-kinase [Gemmatimonadaceae bacterium]